MSDQAKEQDGATDQVAVASESEAAPVVVATEHATEPRRDVQAEAPEPEADPGRSRRPSSLRAAATAASNIPRRKLAPPSFPGSPAFPGSSVQPPVSESAGAGIPGEVPNSGPSLRDKLPLDKLSRDKLPFDKLSVDKLTTLVKQRPEVGLGLAFAGGLIVATMLKRLGR